MDEGEVSCQVRVRVKVRDGRRVMFLSGIRVRVFRV
jgi:hypothetical protein